ncbi:tetratricopeptide repeat protein [Lignipirellula cremea]|uniref:tetratricopeptide repeat protein n=1 Tax=Lignipirellula cremea TaxID=2528010 RepID=UPI0011A644A0|nr:tetratricopeptide repeat protein [Lignipirellula cremea]
MEKKPQTRLSVWVALATRRVVRALAAADPSLRTCGAAWIFCGLLAISGCATFRNQSATENVVSARQKSLEGLEALQRDDWEKAETLFAESVKLSPVDERARAQYAQSLWRRGQEAEALAQMEEAVRLSGRSAELLVELGEMRLARNNLVAARTAAVSALEVNRRLPQAWALRGGINRQLGKLDLALADYHRALAYQPHYPEVQLAAAEIYQEQDRPERRLATLQGLVDQYPPGKAPAKAMYAQGLAYKALQRYDAASVSLLAAVERGDSSAELYYHLSESQFLAGDPANARLAIFQALSRDPNNQEAITLQALIETRRAQMTQQR